MYNLNISTDEPSTKKPDDIRKLSMESLNGMHVEVFVVCKQN